MKKIDRYKYDDSKEELELNDIRNQYTEIQQTDYCKKNEIFPSLQWLNSLNKKIAEAEIAKKHLKEFKNIGETQEELYEVWFYFQPDIYNNGGQKTILTKNELDRLIYRGNELTDVFFVSIYDINESFKTGKLVIPNFIGKEIKKQLNNKEYNSWHKSLLTQK